MQSTKMLQAILDGQVAIRKEIKKGLNSLEKKVDRNGERLDTLGNQLAYLEDDTPTQKEHDKLEKRVVKLEKQFASA